MSCKEKEQLLVNYVLGELSESEKQDLESHLFACVECRQEIDALRGVTDQITDALHEQPVKTKLDDAHRSAILLASGMRLLIWGRFAAFGSIAALFVIGFWGILGQLTPKKNPFPPSRIIVVQADPEVNKFAISEEMIEDSSSLVTNDAADVLALPEEPQVQAAGLCLNFEEDERAMPQPECAPEPQESFSERSFALKKPRATVSSKQEDSGGVAVCNNLESDCLTVDKTEEFVTCKEKSASQIFGKKDILVHRIYPTVLEQVTGNHWLHFYRADEIRLWQVRQGEWIILYYPWNIRRGEDWERK